MHQFVLVSFCCGGVSLLNWIYFLVFDFFSRKTGKLSDLNEIQMSTAFKYLTLDNVLALTHVLCPLPTYHFSSITAFHNCARQLDSQIHPGKLPAEMFAASRNMTRPTGVF